MKIRFFSKGIEIFAVIAFSVSSGMELAENYGVEFDSYRVISI